MKPRVALSVLVALVMFGCSNKEKEEELQKQLSQAQGEQTTLEQSLSERDKYFEEVMKSVNDVYADLERARTKEAQLAAGTTEGPVQFTNAETRQKLLQNIGDIGAGLKANRKTIANLQARMKSFRGEISGLNKLVANLKTSIEEREQSIAQLEAKVQGLETTVAEKTKVITEREGVIEHQQKTMNTAYYIIGTREELKDKGIIDDEGGFLWGLLGSTTVMASAIDQSAFTPVDKTTDQTIEVSGEIDEILPHRKPDLFATAQVEPNRSELTITRPDQFWQDKYLVVVLN